MTDRELDARLVTALSRRGSLRIGQLLREVILDIHYGGDPLDALAECRDEAFVRATELYVELLGRKP